MQDGETLQASARETFIEELEDDESVSESHLTTDAPTILQKQTPKDKQETSKQKDEFREIKIKDERTVNSYFTFHNYIFIIGKIIGYDIFANGRKLGYHLD